MIMQTITLLLVAVLVGTAFTLLHRTRHIMKSLDDLTAAIAAEDTAINQAIVVLDSIPGLIAAAQGSDNPDAALEALAAHVKDQNAAIIAGLQASGQAPAAPVALSVTAPTFTNGMAGVVFSGDAPVIAGGTAPYVVSTSGQPDGISADQDGALSGQPVTEGTSTISWSVSDSSDPVQTASATAILVVDPAG